MEKLHHFDEAHFWFIGFQTHIMFNCDVPFTVQNAQERGILNTSNTWGSDTCRSVRQQLVWVPLVCLLAGKARKLFRSFSNTNQLPLNLDILTGQSWNCEDSTKCFHFKLQIQIGEWEIGLDSRVMVWFFVVPAYAATPTAINSPSPPFARPQLQRRPSLSLPIDPWPVLCCFKAGAKEGKIWENVDSLDDSS